MSGQYQAVFGGRKRRRVNNNAHNTNNNNNNNSNSNNSNNTNNRDNQEIPPPLVIEPKTEEEKGGESKLTHALSILNDKLDIFEREQLDKKKIEMFEVTKQKILSLMKCVESEFINSPHLIGCMPGINGPDQEKLAFNCWLNHFKKHILKDTCIKSITMDFFIQQIISLQTDHSAWHSFYVHWILNRILYDDKFSVIWSQMKMYLNIPYVPANINENDSDLDLDFEDDLKQKELPRTHNKNKTKKKKKNLKIHIINIFI